MKHVACVLGLVAGAQGAWAAVVVVDFDSLPDATAINSQYQPLGVVFSGHFVVSGPGPSTNPVSGPNSAVYFDPVSQLNPYSITATFVVPNTNTPAPTNFVAFTPTDASQQNSLFTLSAYDSLNQLITSVSRFVDSAGVYDPNVDTEMSISAPGIAYATMSVSSINNNVIEGDNFRFEQPVPGPGSAVVLGLAAMGTSRRRR